MVTSPYFLLTQISYLYYRMSSEIDLCIFIEVNSAQCSVGYSVVTQPAFLKHGLGWKKREQSLLKKKSPPHTKKKNLALQGHGRKNHDTVIFNKQVEPQKEKKPSFFLKNKKKVPSVNFICKCHVLLHFTHQLRHSLVDGNIVFTRHIN